ncbi:hypothetical protein TNCV_184591 [Trichonephila clavipes]|nr:hypothetical protein TNCV_184591 [Trichonephila clavipes]
MYHSILLIPCPDPLEAFRIWPPSPVTLTDITDDSRVIKRQSSAENKAVQPLKRLRFKNAFLPFRQRIMTASSSSFIPTPIVRDDNQGEGHSRGAPLQCFWTPRIPAPLQWRGVRFATDTTLATNLSAEELQH